MSAMAVGSVWMLMFGLVASGAGGTEREGCFQFVPGQQMVARIEVDCGQRSGRPVSRLLYGKFTEHLGRNIYHGMWAQLVLNPGFEPADLWGRRAGRIGTFLSVRFGLPQLRSWTERQLPPGWMACGSGEMEYAADSHDPYNSRQCLRMRCTERGGQPAGIGQPLYLPVHRQLHYQWSAYARADRPVPLTVRLVSEDEGKLAAQISVQVKGRDWQQLSGRLQLPPEAASAQGPFRLEIQFAQPATVWLDLCLLFPADHQDGWDPDVVRWVKQSRLPLLRWPGGNFASGYHWKDGIGPLRGRPTRLNRPWSMPEPNHVGTDEFMRFCELAGCEPMICVNAGDGTPEEAADWVEYCNGPTTSRWGKLRAANGHPEPYRVRYWEIGNELYGRWQIGHCTADQYARRYRRFVQAMRRRDPTIRFIANGHNLDWNRALVQSCPDILRCVSVHTLIGGGMPTDTPPEKVWWSVAGFPWEYRRHLAALSDQLRQRVPAGTVAITELQIFTNRPNMPNNGGLAEALFWAGIVHTAIRAGDRIEMITHSALVNHGGGLRKLRQRVYANPVYLARKLYSTQPGRWPVTVRLHGPAFSRQRLHNLPAVHDAPLLDLMALLSDDGGTLVLLAINRDPQRPLPAEIALSGFPPAAEALRQWITADGILAANSLEQPDAVRMRQSRLTLPGPRFQLTFPARSVSAITIARKSTE